MQKLFRDLVPGAVSKMADRNIGQAAILEKLQARRQQEQAKKPAPAPTARKMGM